jgi:hypothetical protein
MIITTLHQCQRQVRWSSSPGDRREIALSSVSWVIINTVAAMIIPDFWQFFLQFFFGDCIECTNGSSKISTLGGWLTHERDRDSLLHTTQQNLWSFFLH